MKTKKILSLLIAMVMALGCVSLPAMAEEVYSAEDIFNALANGATEITLGGDIDLGGASYVAKIGDATYTSLQEALNAAAAGTGNVTVEILDNIDLTNVDWNPVTVSAPRYPVVTVNGNYKTITGLNDMLFAGTWAGGSGLIINDLTIKDSVIVNDKDDEVGTVGVGAFIGYPQASAAITLNNCHLVNSRVEGGHWTGGLIGIAGGYSGNDGPVFMNLTIKDCSVTDSTITGKGSAGGISGHAANDAWTNVVIENTTVSGNTITSTGSSTNKAGAVMGTIGAAGQPTTTNGVTKTGGVSVSATVDDNNVTSNGTAITTIYGRQGSATGMLYVTGGTYDNNPIEEGVTYAQPKEGFEIVQNADGTYGVQEKAPELPNAEVSVLEPLTLEAGSYMTWPSGATNIDRPLEIVMNFKANDTLEDCLAGGYSQWLVDFNLKFTGLENGSITANNCYLAGNYGSFGWIVIPTDGTVLEADVTYPVVSTYDPTLNYKDICKNVQDFTAAIHVDQAILDANPNFKVELSLVMTNPNDADDKLRIGEPAVYTAADLKNETPVAAIGEKKYSSLEKAIEEAVAGDTITLLDNISLTETVTVPAGKTITLDLNGKTITGTDNNTSGNFYLISVNKGNLTVDDSVGDGKITLTATNERNWNSSSVVIANNQGTLTVNGGAIEHLGGTSMAYGIDTLTNGNIGAATTTISGGSVDSTYFAVRQFANSATTMNTVVITGGVVGYVWMQSPNNNVNTATTTISGGMVDGLCVLGVNADYTLSALVSAVGEVYGTMPTGKELTETNGTYSLTDEIEEVEKFGLISTNATLDNSLAINFIYAKSDIVGTDYVAKIKHTTATGIEEKEIPYTDWVANGAYIYVPYEGISAKQMGDRVEITICKEDGTAVSETDFESLENYAINFFNYYETASNMDLWKKAIADMLNYGAAAQTYFGYNTDKLVNGTAAENVNTYASTEVKYAGEYKSYGEGAFATSLNLEDTIELIAIFQGVTDNMTAKVEFVNHNGKSISYDAELKKNGAYHEVIVDKLVVADINQPVRVTVYNADGSEYAWIEDSINEYLGYIQQTEYADPLFEMASKFATSAYAALHAND